METQSLIELRRVDAVEPVSDINSHGNFTVVLKQPIVLNEGDSIVLNRSFIDTRAQLGDTIDLPDGVNVTGKYIIWMQNWFKPLTQGTKEYLQYNALPYGAIVVNNKHVTRPAGMGPYNSPGNFVVCNEPNLTPTVLKQVVGIVVNFTVDVKEGRYVRIIFSSDPNDPTVGSGEFYVFIKPASKTDTIIIPCNVAVGGLDRRQSWMRTDPADNPPFVLADIGKTGADIPEGDLFRTVQKPDGGQAFTPREFEFDFKIPPGKYTPASLAQRVTALMTADQSQIISTKLLGSRFVQTPTEVPFVQVWPDVDVPVISNGEDSNQNRRILDPYGINFFGVQPTEPIYVGASETSLEFDSDSNTFRFTFLHTPILDESGAPSTYQVTYGTLDPSSLPTESLKWLGTAHSGIAFTSLEPKSFWQDTLGFTSSIIADNIKLREKQFIGGAIANIQTPILNLIPGVNITTAFEGAANVLINSPNVTEPDFYDASIAREEFINTSLTTPIVAGPLPPTATDTSHYLVEVSGVPMSQMITSKTQTFSLAGVVGRYQTRGSFTQGAGGDGTPTTIRGGSMILSKLHVRILNPDRTPVTDMGQNSVVFLNLARQVRLPPPLPPLLAAQPPGLLPDPNSDTQEQPPAKKSK